MTVGPGDRVEVEHIDVNHPEQRSVRGWDWDADFFNAWHSITEPIFEPELHASVTWLREHIWPLAPVHVEEVLLPLAQRCWAGERSRVGVVDVVHALEEHPCTPIEIIDALRTSPAFAPHTVAPPHRS
jgi:hypothetical protein